MQDFRQTYPMNPFQISEEDKNVVRHSGMGSHGEKEGTRGNSKMKIWQKGTSRKSRSEWLKDLLDATDKEEEMERMKRKNSMEAQTNSLNRILDRIEKYITRKGNQDDKEALNEFISKKREH